jgi:hypothetical protein
MHHRHTMRGRRQTLFAVLLLGLLAGIAGGAIPVARAASGSVILEIAQAEAINHNTDFEGILPWRWQQDFFPMLGVGDFVTPPVLSRGPEVEQRDWATWDPAFSNTHTWADVRDLGGGDVRGVVQLIDNDDALGSTHFDINPAPGQDLQLRFNVCSLRFTRDDDPARQEFSGFAWIGRGGEGNPGRVQVRMRTADGRSFLPNNIAIADASPVQAVFHPLAIIDGKPTAFMVELTSSHPGPVGATVSVTLNDGISSASDSKAVTIPPEGLRVFLFDGSGSAAPFIPHKQPNLQRLGYTVNVDVPADAHFPDPSGPFPNCVAAADNTLSSSIPVVITDSPGVLYLPWDWRPIGSSDPVRPPTLADAGATFLANERFRRAIFPIADVRSALVPGHAVSPRTTLEPAATIVGWSIAAHAVGLDRVILMPRNGWFAENDASLTFGHGAIGMSLGEIVPHASIAEQGFSEAAVHELGHTFALSRRPCSTGGFFEDVFGLGCRDEYTHAAADGRPYLGSGYDVRGEVYPSGMGGAAGTREVRGVTNLMDTTGARDGGPYDRWIDNLSYDWLTEQLRSPQDPELISLSGVVTVPGGASNPSGALISGALLPSFRYMGIPDRPEAVLNDPNGVGEGQFGVRLVTPAGSRLYRITPAFVGEGGASSERGFFSFSVAWDAATTRIELIGPAKPGDLGQQGTTVVLASRDISAKAPTVSNLRASVSSPAASRAAGAPAAGPLDTILIGWDQSDSDAPAGSLSAILYVIPPRPLGTLGPQPQPIPMAVSLDGSSFSISAAQLANMPGSYGVRVLVTDGANTTALEAPDLFSVNTGVFLPLVTR